MKRLSDLQGMDASMEKVKDTLDGNNAFQFWLFQQRWERLVGDVLASESSIGRYNRDVLYIYVTNSVWMQEFIMRKEDILRRVQEDSYGARFRDIRFQMGPPRVRIEPDLPLAQMASFYDERKRSAPITEEEEGQIETWTAANVEKEALRPLFKDLMRGALRQHKEELSSGWHSCSVCGELCPSKNRLCTRCRLEEERQMRNRIVLMLTDHPEWLCEDVQKRLPATYRQYAEARDVLIHRYRENHSNGCGTEEEMRRLLSLLTHRPFEEISKEEARSILSALPRKKYKTERESDFL